MKKQELSVGVGIGLLILTLTGLPFTSTRAAAPSKEGWPKTLSIYGGPERTSATIAAIGIANIITKYVGVSTTGISTSGLTESTNNLILGKTQMASSVPTGDILGAMEGRKGYQPGAPKLLRVLLTLYEVPFNILTRADSGIKTISDMKGRRAMCRTVESRAQEILVESLLWAYGMTFNDFKATPRLNWEDQANALKEKTTDVIMRPINYPSGLITKLSREVPLYYIPVDKNKEISKKFPENASLIVPAGAYDFLKKDVPAIGLRTFVIIRSDVPEDLVYEITKAIYTHLDELKATHPLFRQLDMEYGISDWHAPYHAGVIKYYKEVGKWTLDNEKSQREIMEKLGLVK
jgi:TRAP transporter TAXI family solute receptor